jgi:hypothetical protein
MKFKLSPSTRVFVPVQKADAHAIKAGAEALVKYSGSRARSHRGPAI